MQLKKRLLAIATVMLLTAISFVLFSMLQLFGKQTHLEDVPLAKNTTWTLKFDAANFWKEEVYTILFEEKDELFLKSIKALAKDQFNQENKGSLGINLQTDVIVCGWEHQSKTYTVILVDLISPKDFEKNIGTYLSKQQIGGIINNTGIIVVPNQKTSQQDLKMALNNWQKAPLTAREKLSNKQDDFIAYRQISISDKSPFKAFSLGISQTPESFEFSGKCTFQSGRIEPFSYDLKPTGFYLASRIIPLNLEDTLNKYLPLGDFSFSKINGIVMDYNGVYLEESKAGMPDVFGYLPIPKINLIISFEEAININTILEACPPSIVATENTLNFGETDYHLKQLNPYTVFIGIDPSQIIQSPQVELLKIKGELKYLTSIDGSDFIATIAQSMSPTRLSNDFIKATTEMEVHVKQTNKDHFLIHGDLYFKPGKKPIHELSKLILAFSKD